MSNELATISKELSDTMSLGDIFVKSGMFPDIKAQAQAVVKILAGRELGLSPLESMTNIYIVNGKVALQAKVIAALIKKSGKYDYQIEKQDNEECTIAFFQKDGTLKEIGKSTFTIKDAAKAGIINKDSWKNYPKNMLFARALSNGARFYCPDVYSAYTPEELDFGNGKVKQEPIEVEPTTVGISSVGEVIQNGEKA
jgi:hypothetical protein